MAVMTITPPVAGLTDINYPPATFHGGYEISYSPIGQTFKAIAASVNAGLYIEDAWTAYQASVIAAAKCTPQCGVAAFPAGITVAPSVTVRLDVYAGEGIGATALASRTVTLSSPFSGFVDLPVSGLIVGNTYSIVLTDTAPTAAYKHWNAPSVYDTTPGAGVPVYGPDGTTVVGYQPYGSYYGGLPILSGQLITSDSGAGDISFRVIDAAPAVGASTCSGSAAIISYPISKFFMQLDDGSKVGFTPTAAGTTFTGGTTTFANGEWVTYSGIYSPSTTICQATQMTVAPAPAVVNPPPVVPPAPRTCKAPRGAQASSGKGRITEIGTGYFKVGSTVVNHVDCTRVSMSGAKAFKPGQKVEWEGYSAASTGIVAQRITVD